MAGVVLEGLVDAPCPRVGITISDLDTADVSVVTVWRTVEGMPRRAVRGARSITVLTSTYILDYEAPLGREVTYTLEVEAGAVVPAELDASITLYSDDGWMQDPLNPGSAVPVSGSHNMGGIPVFTSSAMSELEHNFNSEMAQVLGTDYPVVLGGQRLAAANIPFTMLTDAAEWNTALKRLLLGSHVVLLRCPPTWGNSLPPLAYLKVSVREIPAETRWGGTLMQWDLSGDLVAPPAARVVIPVWTYDAIRALYVSYDAAQAGASALGASYTDDLRDPTHGGI